MRRTPPTSTRRRRIPAWAWLVAGACVLGALYLAGPTIHTHGHSDSRSVTRAIFRQIDVAAYLFKARHRRLPATLEELTRADSGEVEPYLSRVPDDGWQGPIQYYPRADGSITLRSWGADGRPGTDDDLLWPEEAP